jgi:hypothetical protein
MPTHRLLVIALLTVAAFPALAEAGRWKLIAEVPIRVVGFVADQWDRVRSLPADDIPVGPTSRSSSSEVHFRRHLDQLESSSYRCRPGRECTQSLAVSDGQLVITLSCAGRKVTVGSSPRAAAAFRFDGVVAKTTTFGQTSPHPFHLAPGLYGVPARVRVQTPQAASATARAPSTATGLEASRQAPVLSSDRSYSVACGPLVLDLSSTTGGVKITFLGVFSARSDGRLTYSMQSDFLVFEVSVHPSRAFGVFRDSSLSELLLGATREHSRGSRQGPGLFSGPNMDRLLHTSDTALN